MKTNNFLTLILNNFKTLTHREQRGETEPVLKSYLCIYIQYLIKIYNIY